MNDDPLKVFAYVLSNTVVIVGCLVMAALVLPRLRIRMNTTIVAGMAFFLLNGLQHAYVTYGILFGDFPKVGASYGLLMLRVGTAIALAVFITGIFIDVSKWKRLEDRMTTKDRADG